MQSLDFDVRRVVSEEEDRPVELVVRVENFCARKAIPPGLSIAVDHPFAVDLDVSRMKSAKADIG